MVDGIKVHTPAVSQPSNANTRTERPSAAERETEAVEREQETREPAAAARVREDSIARQADDERRKLLAAISNDRGQTGGKDAAQRRGSLLDVTA